MQDASQKHFRPPVGFDIEEVSTSFDKEEKDVVNAGAIEAWERLVTKQNAEKSKLRPYITGLTMILWAIYIVVGLIRCILGGDTSLLISSSLWFVPISAVFKFYFG
jgi:hypothetical protein